MSTPDPPVIHELSAALSPGVGAIGDVIGWLELVAGQSVMVDQSAARARTVRSSAPTFSKICDRSVICLPIFSQACMTVV